MREFLAKPRWLSLFVLMVFLFSSVFLPSATVSGSYTPPATLEVSDFIAEDSEHMITYPRFGTPIFIEPGQDFIAEVAHDSVLGLTGWTAWLENDYQVWDCGVGPVTYGTNNIYLGMRTGYNLTIYTPRDITPELLNLVIKHESGVELRAPMSVSVVPTLNTNFYALGITDTHFYTYGSDDDEGSGDAKGLEMQAKMMTVAGARFISHTGDSSVAGHVGRREAIKQYIITPVGTKDGRVPFIFSEGNHEYDLWVWPAADNNNGQLAGDNTREDMDRTFGMRSQIIKIGSFAYIKHGYGSYWGAFELRHYLTQRWNELTGITYRMLGQHTHTHSQSTPMFQVDNPPHSPMPSPYPDVELKGHDHQLTVNGRSPFLILSLGGMPWTYAEGVPFNYNYNAATDTWTSPQFNASIQRPVEIKFCTSLKRGSERGKIRESFANANDGSATTNTATVENDIDINYYDGRTRFVMAPGYYEVAGGEVVSQYPSADGTKQIVLARINIPASGSASVSVSPGTPPAATPAPTPFPIPPLPAPTPEPTPIPVYTGPGDNAVPNADFEADFGVGVINNYPEQSSYTIGTWAGTNAAKLQNNSRAIQIDIQNIWRDKDGHYIEIPLKDGFKVEVGKKYGAYFWAYSDAVDGNRNAAITLQWHENPGTDGRYSKTSMVSDLSDANGWKINGVGGNGEIWDLNFSNEGTAVRVEEISRMRPVVRLFSNHSGGTTSAPGQDLKCFDNIYITEIDSPPHIYEVVSNLSGGKISSIDVHLAYPIKRELFTGAGTAVSGGANISNVELIDLRTIRVTFASALSAGQYSVALGSDAIDLFGRDFVDGKTIDFTEEGGFSGPPPTPTPPPEDKLVLKNIWPKNNEKRVYIKPTVNLQFGLPVLLPAVSEGKIKINGDTALVEAIKADADDPARFSVVLKQLQPFTTYTVTVDGIRTTDSVAIPAVTTRFTTAEAGLNLFENHGFETKADGFDALRNSITPEDPHSGAYSVKTANAEGENWLLRWGGYEVGKTYGFSSYFKVTPESAAVSGGIRVEVRPLYQAGGEYREQIAEINGITKTAWTHLGGKYVFPPHPLTPGSAVQGMVWMFPPNAGIRYFLDDFVVKEIPATLGITQDGTVYEGADLAPGEPIIIAFNRDMEQNLSSSAIKIDGVAAAAVAPLDISARRFVITPATPLTTGTHTITITGAMDIYYNVDDPDSFAGSTYNGSLSFGATALPTKFEFDSFRLYDGALDITGGQLPEWTAVKAVAANVKNVSDEGGGVSLVVALYRDGRLCRVVLEKADIAAGAAEAAVEATLTTPAMGDGASYTLRAFLWEGLTALKPIHSLFINN